MLSFFIGIGAAWSSLILQVESVGEVAPGSVVGIVHGAGELARGAPSGYGAVHVFTLRDGLAVRDVVGHMLVGHTTPMPRTSATRCRLRPGRSGLPAKRSVHRSRRRRWEVNAIGTPAEIPGGD